MKFFETTKFLYLGSVKFWLVEFVGVESINIYVSVDVETWLKLNLYLM